MGKGRRNNRVRIMHGTVERIRVFPAKGETGRELNEGIFIEDLGLEGDFHAKGGGRQISLFFAGTDPAETHSAEKALCFSRFGENITIRGIDPSVIKSGMLLSSADAILEVTAETKHCHEECELFKAGETCSLAGLNLFARVLKSGLIRLGDRIEIAKEFTHFDSRGNAVMVDVSEKEISERVAVAKGSISMSKEAMRAVQGGTVKKGDVLSVARIAGIMATKRCAELIPLCHSLCFEECAVDFIIDKADESSETKNVIEACCRVKLSGKTGAEMEALTGVSVALLTIYDMCKAIDRAMVISNIRLWEKSGGRSGRFKRNESSGKKPGNA
jgi:cyclic pyranopterin phosphate synthase